MLTKAAPPLCLLAAALLLLLLPSSDGAQAEETCSGAAAAPPRRGAWMSVASFGGRGDGQTLNTAAFARAVARIERRRGARGGSLLYVPPGVWLTGPFNLTSHMTLFLARGAVIRATQDTSSWPLIDPLPSYGRGRELPGGRYMSLIHGNGLQDVFITGENGTIDGQGSVWWDMWKRRTLPFTRPHLLELMYSTGVIVSNVVFQDSPFWNIHPVYCSFSIETGLQGLLRGSDSSNNVCIEDSYISAGDDLISIKSGWDEYGIAFGRPSSGITIRRITGSGSFAGFAIGSETSGGVENVLVEHLNFFNMGVGIHIKTNSGRGGFIRNITVSEVTLNGARYGLRIAGDVGGHPDTSYNPNVLPIVDSVTIKNVWGQNIRQAGLIRGIKNSVFSHICLSNVKLYGRASIGPWKCQAVSGGALDVQPSACAELASTSETGFCTT
nr:unnamed protein product [Digitaria exilis]